ncbi:DNA mismatch repair protein MutS [Caloramator quimbayensis]|uniref:DNA mismatch repair protein MutS n=1 Tax=Caloramator quimbayensis TaxID=1147123 RepID=A0A1T4XAI8_9CLOT|nr:DNA mismatch repair protein MutS [Caloramator quimbayensis]
MALTPMMLQYLEIKDSCKDCILFFRLGDFYEMFFEDAKTASRELEIALTGRDCGLDERAPMCGVPYHSADTYISKLIEKGYKVAICEQVEDPALAKGIVKREIIRVVTPGTIIESNMLDERVNNYISCVLLNKDSFSLSVCDISTGEFLVTSGGGSIYRVIDELSKYNPSELIIIDNDLPIDNKAEKIIKDRFNLLLTYKKHNEDDNIFLNKKFSNLDGFNENEIIVCSCLFNYIRDNQKSSLMQITSIKKYMINDFMVLDSTARRNLELTETIRGKSSKGSLLWLLDKTRTSMGGRMLRKWIEEPLISTDEINKRLDAVEELISNVYVCGDLKEFLKNIYDIERLISRISCSAANARDLMSLKESLKNLPDIKSALSECRCEMLRNIYNDFDILEDIYNLIDKSISDNPPLTLKEGGIIKDGYSADVDKLRNAMKNGKGWIADLEQKEREITGIKSLKVGYNKVFGYYIEITKSNLSSIPEGRYIRKQTLSNCERYITSELKEMEDLILNSEQKVIDIEYQIFTEIRDKVAREVVRIQKTARQISIVDSLLSFAIVSFENNYSKPVITNDGIIKIEEGRHPVVEKVLNSIFVPNDTYLDLKDNMIAIITGPNMAGKSTYMRQVALITLMAQIGCFVPAKSASISIVDRIFTRIGASDDLASGQSTFMVEMSEVSNILQNATKNSLILLDEVGRGTSTFDGLSIAWAVIDYISKKIGAKTLFATHYHELTELEGKLSGTKNYCISIREHGDDIIFLRKIIRGGADQSYGIQVAKLSGLPDEVVIRAREILSKLEESDINKGIKLNLKQDEVAATIVCEDKKEINLFNFKENEIIAELKELDIMNMTPMDAINHLYRLCTKAKKI